MSFPANYKFSVSNDVQLDFQSVSSPTQTVAGGTDWYVDDIVCSVVTAKGGLTSAAVKTDGTLWLWGQNSNGVLGNNNNADLSSPVQTVTTGTNWKQVDLFDQHTGAIKYDGTLWLWGQNDSGMLGNGDSGPGKSISSPVQTVSATTNWKQVSVGRGYSAAVKTDGTLWIWGDGADGKLGTNSNANISSPSQTIACGTNWKQVSLGRSHSAAIKTDGTLWTWGLGTCGRLGDNSNTTRSSPVQTISTAINWKQVSIGENHSSAIKTDGTLWLWGRANQGQLGNNISGAAQYECSPIQAITTGSNWKQVSLGNEFTGAVKTDGTLWMWGNGGTGKLGTNSGGTSYSSPVQTVSTATNWRQVSAGNTDTIASKLDGTLWGWGKNEAGQLGNNTSATVSSPVQTIAATSEWSLEEPAFTVAAGTIHSAAVKTDGTLWLWGCGLNGVLGNNSTINQSSPVQTVSATTNWKQVSLGREHSAATKSDGTLWIWGCGCFGRLGNNSTLDVSSPIQTVSAATNWKQVGLGNNFSAAIKTDGTLWTWGKNLSGALGTNSTTDASSPVQTVSTGTNWKQLSASFRSVAAVKTDGTLWLWGVNDCGKLGNNSTTDASSPVQTVSTGTNWKQVSIGGTGSAQTGSVAAIKTDGTLWLWGEGSSGNLGNNSTINHSSPVQTVSIGTNWKQVGSGDIHSAAVKTDGTLWMWGNATCGRLGNNSTVSVSSPVQTICTNIKWSEVAAGCLHSTAITEDQELYNWGNNTSGELGIPRICNLSVQAYVDFDDVFIRKEIFSQGGLWGWGCNVSGSIGNNNTVNISSPVQTTSGGVNWCQLGTGCSNGAAVKTDGTLWLWGSGGSGRLGTNSATDVSSPVQTVSAGTNWKQVWGGTSAIKTDGTLWVWGIGIAGKLGDNSATTKSSPVQTVSTGTNWKQSSVGVGFMGAIKTDGTLWVWGCGQCGKLGNNDTINYSSPIQTVSTDTNWKQLSLGQNHSAAIKTDGTLWLWGSTTTLASVTQLGLLGDNSITSKSSPVQTVSTGTNWKQVSLGHGHSAAIKTDGTLWLWGSNLYGELGTNFCKGNSVSSPIQTVSAGTNWKKVSLGGTCVLAAGARGHTAAVKTDGTLWMWGSNNEGQLGLSSTISQSSPVQTVVGGVNWIDISLGDDFTFGIREDCY